MSDKSVPWSDVSDLEKERDALKAQLAEVREAYELKRMAFDLLAQGAAKVTRENVRLKDELMRLNGLKDER